MRDRFLAGVVVGLGLLVSGVSQAAIITYAFTAELVSTSGPDTGLFPVNLSGRFGYDTSVPDANPVPTLGQYDGAAGDFALDGLFVPPAFGPPQVGSVVNVSDDTTDLLIWGAAYDIGGPSLVAVFEINGTSSLFASDALPAALPLDQISSAVLTLALVDDGTSFGTYRLTSLTLTQVPEPTGMFGAALLGLVALARMRRSAG